MPYEHPAGLPADIYYGCLGCPPSPPAPPPTPPAVAAITTAKQGIGLRILLEFDLGASGSLYISWSRTEPTGGPVHYGALKSSTDLANFSDWLQIPDADFVLHNRKVVFDSRVMTVVELHQEFDLANRLVTVRFWLDGTPYSAAMTIALLKTRRPIEYDEVELLVRAVGIQRDLPDRVGDIATLDILPDILPEDLGRLLPIVVGTARKVRGIEAKSAATTVLEGAIDFNDTTITVADTTRFPSSGTIAIDDEAITYTGKTATTFTGATRGASSTAAANHFTGAQVLEVGQVIYLFSGVEAHSFGNVYGPNGQIIPGGTKNGNNAVLIPGRRIATVTYGVQPMIDVIEGPTSFQKFQTEVVAGPGPTFDPWNCAGLDPRYTESNFCRLLPGGTSGVTVQVPVGAIEDLGEIVQIRALVRHHGFGINENVVEARIPGGSSLGALEAGTIREVEAVDVGVSVSGAAQVTTDIAHQHVRSLDAIGTITSPDDVASSPGVAVGWLSLFGGESSGTPGPIVIGPVKRHSVLSFEESGAAIHKYDGATNQTLDIKWDISGSIADINLPLKSIEVVIVHGNPVGTESFTYSLVVSGQTLVNQRPVTGSGVRTTVRSGPIDVQGRQWTVANLHASGSRIRLAPLSSISGRALVVHACFAVVEVFEMPFGSTLRPGSGPISGQGDLTSRKDTWEIVEEFFDIPASDATDWDDLSGLQLELAAVVQDGAEVWVREIAVEIEYRKRVRRKPDYLLADMNGARDRNHPSGAGDGTYTGSGGALISNPIQQLEWWFTEVMGFARTRIDTTYNDTQEAAYTTDGHSSDGALVESMDALKFVQRFLFEHRMRLFLWQDKVRFKRIPLIEDAVTAEFNVSNVIVEDTQERSPVFVTEVDEETLINRIALHFGRKSAMVRDQIPKHTGGSGVRRGLVSTDSPAKSEFESIVISEDSSSMSAVGERRREYFANFIDRDATTVAQGIIDLYVAKYATGRRTVEFHATFASLLVAVDDVVTLVWPTLGISSTTTWRVIKEQFLIGDPSAKRAPRKRFKLLELLPAEVT